MRRRRRYALRSASSPLLAAAPCGLATSDRPLRVRRGQPLAGWPRAQPAAANPLRAVAPVGGRPLQGALATTGCPLQGKEENRRWWLKL
ncbi:hypothetical protein GW17_00035552 [Ensete ventricosum]|nr:hypothetical protein GW17_00035552 [Ensete ventricosum]